jgi:uncharacterized protein (TIGR02284 family)
MEAVSDPSKVAFAFSRLNEINHKRSDRYTAAAQKVRNAYRKTVLMNYAYHAQQLSAELKRWLTFYKVDIRPQSENATEFSWEKIKSLFFKESENHVYEDCEMLEEEAMRGYNTAITLSFIPPKAMGEVKRHLQHIERIRASLKEMKRIPCPKEFA